jgi:integration host factor subunit alpha
MCAEILSSPLAADPPRATGVKRKTSRTVTRNDLATAVMKRVSSLSRREATRIVDCALSEISNALSQGAESVKLHEFGTFVVREKPSGVVHDPATADSAAIRPRRFLRFKPSFRLKEKVAKSSTRNPTLEDLRHRE